MFLTITIVVLCGVSLTFGDKTFGEVRKCVDQSYDTCKIYCQKYHPNWNGFDTIKKCFEDNRNEFESCLMHKGVIVIDSTPCFPIGYKNGTGGMTLELPNPANCYKRCLNRSRKRCHRDCIDERKEKPTECTNEDQIILDCLQTTSVDTIDVNGTTPRQP